MRTYYAFIIKDSLMHFYSKRPYSLYKILEQIYRLKNNDIMLGYRLLEQVTKPFGINKINKFIYKKHFDELEYSRINDCTSFFNSIGEYDDNIFVCDFENQDFFFINKINFQTIV